MMNNRLYPLKFQPIFREKIWGGTRIRDMLGLDTEGLPNCGEAWVLSGVPGNETVVSEGFLEGNELNELVEVYMDDLVGEKVFEQYPDQFPILVKFIDANDYLSIQVHPNDEMARKKGLKNGKSEMWYIVSAEKDAELIIGFNRKVDRQQFLRHLEEKSLMAILNVEKVAEGDVFFIPAGRVHALGPGILLAEIQQTSDITYRIYDYDRTDSRGNPRELHVTEALDAMDFEVYSSYRIHYPHIENKSVELVNQAPFITNLIDCNTSFPRDYSALDSFVILTCVSGNTSVEYRDGKVSLIQGECLLIPAELEKIVIHPLNPAKILETFIGHWH